MKKLLAALAMVFFLVGCCSTMKAVRTQHPDMSVLSKKMEGVVAYLYTPGELDDFCTAVIVEHMDKPHALTAAHCMAGEFIVHVEVGDTKYTAVEKFHNMNYDLSLVEIVEPFVGETASLASGSPEELEMVCYIGGPLNYINQKYCGRVADTDLENLLSKVDSPDLLRIDAPVYQGSSGSPVFNINGELVGLVVQGSVAGLGSAAVKIETIKEFLGE